MTKDAGRGEAIRHVICDVDACRSMVIGEKPPREWIYVGWDAGRKRYICPRCERKRRRVRHE